MGFEPGFEVMNNQSPDMYDRLRLLQQYRHIAIVGISTDQYRPSHFVAIYLQAEGYDIILVNPNYVGQTLLGKRVYASLTEAKETGEQIEIVDVFRKAEDIPPIAQEAINIGAKVLWLQLGIHNDEVGKEAMQLRTRMRRTREATAAHAHRLHPEIPPIFLHQHVRRNFARAEERMRCMVDRHRLELHR